MRAYVRTRAGMHARTHTCTHERTHAGTVVKDRQGHRYKIPPLNHSCSWLYTWRRLRLIWSLIQSVGAAGASEKAHQNPAVILLGFFFAITSCSFITLVLIFVERAVSLQSTIKFVYATEPFPLHPHSISCFYSFPKLLFILVSKSILQSTKRKHIFICLSWNNADPNLFKSVIKYSNRLQSCPLMLA